MYRRSLSPQKPERPVSGSSWSWWKKKEQEVPKVEPQAPTQYAKTLRLSSDQLVYEVICGYSNGRNNFTFNLARILFTSLLHPRILDWQLAPQGYFFGKTRIK